MTAPEARTIRGRAGDDGGFILVEVLVSMLILILVGASAFTALEQGDKLSGQQVNRAMAANMAQAEIERIRSLPIEDVAGIRGERIMNDPARPKIDFKVTATAKWVTDGLDEPVCATRSGGLDYMRLTVKVVWDGIGVAKPVTFSTVVTPASRASSTTAGSLSVNVLKADGKTGVSNLEITLVPKAGGTALRETTNDNGCAVFPFVPAVQYALKFSRTGWVNQNSVANVDDTVSVPAGGTNKVEYLFDQGGFTKANFITRRSGFLTDSVSQPLSIALYNGDQTPGPVTDPMSGTTSTWDTGKPLFPSESPYIVYAGACGENSTGANATAVNISPGLTQNAGAVRVPSYDLRVYDGASAATSTKTINGAKVVFNASCGNYTRYTVGSGGLGVLDDPTTGRLVDPGFPYTTAAQICVSWVDTAPNPDKTYRWVKTVANTNMSVIVPSQPVYIKSQGEGAAC